MCKRLLIALTALCCALAALWVPAQTAPDVCHIRALLAEGGKSSVTVGGELQWSDGSRSVGTSNMPVEVRRVGEQVKIVLGDRGIQAAKLIATPRSGHLRHAGKQYRGSFELFAGKAGGVALVNRLPLDDYLLGVVPAEMPSSWPTAALEAQAIAARTYAVSRMLEKQDATYDVVATVMDQVYRGVDGETPQATAAVRNTAGRIVTFDGRPIVAYFCSDAGGCTKCGKEPYLQSVPIESPDSPHNQWSLKLSKAELAALVKRNGGRIGNLSRIETQLDGASGHLLKLVCIGDAGSHTFTGAKLRELVGYSTMKSTRAWVEIVGQQAEKPDVMARPAVKSPKPAPAGTQEVVAVQIAKSEPETRSMFLAGRSSANLPSYSRPWVLYVGGMAGLKLRNTYVSNGKLTVPAGGDLIALGVAAAELTMAVASQAPPEPPESVPAAAGSEPLRYEPPTPHNDNITAANDAQHRSTSGPVGPDGIVLHGRGYGHGMGLSQYGAKTLAERGMSHAEILHYFYSGTQLGEIDGRMHVRQIRPGGQRRAKSEKGQAGESVPVFYEPFAPGRK